MTGRDGRDGRDGAPGMDGPEGPQGPRGLTGEKGDLGPRGEQGPAGPSGPEGPEGPAGPPGRDGADGERGPQGPQGPPGEIGPQGPSGRSGSDGDDGLSILHGFGQPVPEDGRDGEFWLDLETQTLYGPKIGGEWPIGFSVVGPEGPRGQRGPQGERGFSGGMGLPGPAGPAGPSVWGVITGILSDQSDLQQALDDRPESAINETISGAWQFADTITLPKTSGKGIKIDTSAPTFGWEDLLGSISIRGTGATDPSYNIYRGGIRGYQFDTNEEVFIEFHLPHNYVPGSDIYIHFHHSINGKTTAGVLGGAVTGGTVTWGAECTYAKGHNQAAFAAPITTTVQSGTYASTLYQHYITEVQLSAASPSASQLDSDDLEVDGLILVRVYLSANNITVTSGAVPAPFLHFADIHYQSTGIGTKNKAPNFWS